MPVDLWRQAHRAAEQAGLSLSGYLTELVARDEIDPTTGAPTWASADTIPGLELNRGDDQLTA